MEETFIDAQKGEEEEESQCSLNKEIGLADDCISEITASKLKQLVGRLKAEKTLVYKQQAIGEGCVRGSFLQRVCMDFRIPKYMRFVTVNEIYLQHWLDLVEFGAANSLNILCNSEIPCSFAVNLRSSEMEVSYNNKLRQCQNRSASDLGNFVIQCLSATGSGQWIVRTIEGNETARNILKGPLLHHLGALDSIMNIGRVGFIDSKETKDSDFMSSASGFSSSSPQKRETGTAFLENKNYGSKPFCKRLFSISSAKSTDSDQSSSAAFSQGMLQCTWKNGIPFFVYSVDDQRKVYVANLLKVESSNYKDIDYIYLFYSKTGGIKEHGTCDKSLDLVGKMKISSSLTLCSDNSKLMETEFILFGADAKYIGNTAASNPILTKKRELPKKVVDVIRAKHLLRHCSFPRPTSIPEDSYWDQCEDLSNKLDTLGEEKILASPCNFEELAAIVVKEQLHDNHQQTVVGGWGLKFLEKLCVQRANTSQEASVSSDSFQESSLRDKNDYSTSMNVLIPAGFHGGPRTRNGGPSSLIERWRSGGHCDCGGWDIGCPLTVLNNKSSKEVPTHAKAEEKSKSLDLVIEGGKQDVPSLKMVNIHDSMYSFHFQPTLSALQSFSIGVAMIHTESHSLSPKNVQKFKR